MKKALSIILTMAMIVTAFPMSLQAGTGQSDQDLFFEGLANPKATQTTKNYDGYKFVVGSKSTWDCKLYTLTATASKISGTKVTFDVTFKNKISESYAKTSDYSVDVGWKTFKANEKIQYTLDLEEAHEGMNFLKLKVNRHERNKFTIYPSNQYYDAIRKNRKVAPEGVNYIDEYWLEDVYALSYYKRPDLYLNTNYFQVKSKSISLGTYTFKTIVYYKAKTDKKWKQKTFKMNQKIQFKGLKAGKTYYFRALFALPYEDPIDGKKKEVVDSLQDTFYLTTIINKKPKVASVKISKAKFGRKKIDGYWETHADSRSVWHRSETMNTATYTVKVKLKNVPKDIRGLYLKSNNASYFQKGKKKTYTFKMYYQDRKKLKGKKMTFQFAYASNAFNNKPVGIGPYKKVKYKLKNGTYK